MQLRAPRRLSVPWRQPADLAPQLAKDWGASGLIWLDGDGSARGRFVTLATDPVDVHCCRGGPDDPHARDPFSILRQLGPGHWCGWLSYEAAAWTEPGNPWARDAMASLWIARHDPVLRFDLQEQQMWIEGTDPVRLQRLERWLNRDHPSVTMPVPSIGIDPDQWHWHSDRTAFAAGVRRIRELIACGDLFQANLTACCSTTWPQDRSPLELFLRLRLRCPAPFGGLLIGAGDAGDEAVLNVPRTISTDGRSRTCGDLPDQGTRPGQDADRAQISLQIWFAAQDRAENVMIVDLLRKIRPSANPIHPGRAAWIESYAAATTSHPLWKAGRVELDLLQASCRGESPVRRSCGLADACRKWSPPVADPIAAP